MPVSESALVLFSGGQDSTVCLAWALQRFSRVETVGFHYGQRHAIELEVRPRICERLSALFPEWSGRLSEDHLVRLDALTEIADTLIRHPEIRRVEVQGHTDNSGTPEHNKVLSEQRAEAVRAWLVQHGVAADRLVARGYGQEKPLVPNVTAGNRARNRRVQFIILEKEGGAPAAPAGGATPKKTPTPGF